MLNSKEMIEYIQHLIDTQDVITLSVIVEEFDKVRASLHNQQGLVH